MAHEYRHGLGAIGRVSYTGDLGYEIWCDWSNQIHIFETLMNGGAAFNVRLFAARANPECASAGKWRSRARERRPIYSPLEAELDRFVALGKETDIGGKASARSNSTSMCFARHIASPIDQSRIDKTVACSAPTPAA